ncbi:hypothetical protein PQR68_07500 [Paraburkholderia agricolaris]|uniref:hypothetical protein n=1 Tax=Paraburkholderia agricolaris TaxID=2152888 RepID=UPI0038B75C90
MNDEDSNNSTIFVRPNAATGWQVVLPHSDDPSRRVVAVVGSKEQALKLATQMRPDFPILVLPNERHE